MMVSEQKTGSKKILYFFLVLMVGMIIGGIVFYKQLKGLFYGSVIYPHVLFVHIVSVTLFFANAVIGILWESRSLASGKKEIIFHTYRTVTWLDARFSSPLIILSVISGVLLTLIIGDIWKIGWLFVAFILFLLSGIVWVLSDIPTQYKIKTLSANIDPGMHELPPELLKVLKMRIWISIAGVLPLVIVFVLMVYKPNIKLIF